MVNCCCQIHNLFPVIGKYVVFPSPVGLFLIITPALLVSYILVYSTNFTTGLYLLSLLLKKINPLNNSLSSSYWYKAGSGEGYEDQGFYWVKASTH